MALITINGVSLDPQAQAVGLQAAGLEAATAADSDYVLIQTQAPLTPVQKQELAGLGVEIQEYVPELTYLCGYRPADLDAIRALPYVTWANVYMRGFKIPPSLRPPTLPPAAAIVPMAATHRPSRKPRQVDVVLHDDVDPADQGLQTRIAAAAGVDPTALQVGRRKIRMTVAEGDLDRVAALDEVHHLEPVPVRQLFNNVARQIINAEVLVNGTEFRGAGQIIAVADTGFDKGSTTNVHPAFTGRVARLYALGRPSPAKANDPQGHGTHVAGSVLGAGQSAKMGGAIEGTAPEATLVLQSTLDAGGGLGGLPDDLHDLFEPPYDDDGARVHTNSWGNVQPGLPYDASAQEIDDVVWNRQDLVICFAAGNDGTDHNSDGITDLGSIGSQSAAKNCITVGASESVRATFKHTYGEFWPTDFPVNPIKSDLQANNADGMVGFSSRGPTRERRTKPDVVAPGTCILSTLSRDVVTPSTDFGSSKDRLFFFDSGTSMATPLVAGCAAVLRETLVENGMATPTAALVKALLINGAVDIGGQYSPTEAAAVPNNNEGFGRVDLAGSVILPGDHPDAGLAVGGPLDEGNEDTAVIEIPAIPPGDDHGVAPAAAGGATLKITLVWTDPPGAALQNDLDLIVRASDGTERHGNMGTAADFDRLNNVEQVWWPNMPAGPAEITIRAFRITRFPQPYAYAWRIN
jgi:serine protease AprX